MKPRKITVLEDGPYLVEGGPPLSDQHIVTDRARQSVEWKEGKSYPVEDRYRLCRCGKSANKPFCDETHRRVDFDGTETASRAPYAEQAERFDGPALVLDDAEKLCAYGRFCDPHGRVWNLVERSDEPEARKWTEHEAGHCPAGRLVARLKATGEALEPLLPPSLGLVQDTALHVSGPIWVRGGIPVVSASGEAYEVRNRVALCRCGASSNKPYCDGSHASIHFRDRDPER